MTLGLINHEGQALDRLGRRVPHRMNAITFERAIPGFLARFREIPNTHWAHAEGQLGVGVSCPCGHPVDVDPGRMANCEGCERVYLYTGTTVLVGNSPARKEAA